SIERRAHTLTNRLVPRTLVFLDVDTSVLPQRKFGEMGARAIAARYERSLFFLDGLKGFGDVLHTLNTCGITLRSDEDEVIVHNRVAVHSVALGYELFFRGSSVDKNDIRITTPSGIESLTRTLSDDFHVDAGCGLEQRQDMAKQTGILRRCG